MMTGESGDRSDGLVARMTARRWPIVLIGIVLLLIVGGVVALKLLFPPERLRAMVVPRVEAVVGREVRLSSVSLKLFPRVAVRLEGFAIANAEGFGPEPALELRALDLRPRVLPLLRGRVELKELRLLEPVIRYEVGPDGVSNFSGIGASAGGAAGSGGMEAGGGPSSAAQSVGLLAVADLSVQDGRAYYRDATSGRHARVDEIDASLASSRPAGSEGALRSGGRIDLRGVQVVLPSMSQDSIAVPDLVLDFELFADLEADSAALSPFRLTAGDLRLTGSGSAHGLTGETAYSLHLESDDADIRELLSILPPDAQPQKIRPSGQARVALQVEQVAGDTVASVSGRVELEEIEASWDGGTLLTSGSGSLAFSRDSLALAPFRSQLFGRPFELQATIRDFKDPRLSARVTAALELARLAELRGAEWPAQGVVSVDLQVSGPLDRPSALNVAGPVRLANVQYRTERMGVPARIASGTIRFATPTISIEELPIEIGSSDLTVSLSARNVLPLAFGEVSGEVTPTVEFRATSKRFDWGEVFPNDTSTGYSDLLTARLAGRAVGGRDPGDVARERYRPPPLPPVQATGRVGIAEFHNPPTVVRNLSFRVSMAGGRLGVERLTGKVYGGDLSGSMSLDVEDGRPPFPLRYELTLTEGEAGTVVRRWTRLGAAVSGVMDLSLQGTAALDETLLPVPGATDASGRAIVRNGEFQNFGITRRLADQLRLDPGLVSSFRRLGGPFRIEGDAFVLESWRMVAPELTAQITGSAGLGGTLDLQLALEVPASTLRESGLLRDAGLGSVANALLGQQKNLQIGVGVVGTMSDPTFQVDTESLQKQLQGTGEDLLKRLFRPPR